MIKLQRLPLLGNWIDVIISLGRGGKERDNERQSSFLEYVGRKKKGSMSWAAAKNLHVQPPTTEKGKRESAVFLPSLIPWMKGGSMFIRRF